MAYDTKELEAKALEAIQKYKLIWIEEIVTFLPCSKGTFYNLKLHELDTLKDAIEGNKITIKLGLRKKMYDSESATDRALLYKLCSTDEELNKISLQNIKTEHSGNIEISNITVKVKRPADGT